MKYLTLFLAILVYAPSVHAVEEIDPKLDQEIRLMLKLTGSEELGISAMKMMIASFKQSLPDVPESFWVAFQAEVKPGELTELVVPIYAKHLTLEQVAAANRFYASPEGKELVSKQPVIMTESMAAGEVWGQSIAQLALKKLQQENHIPKGQD